MQALNVAKTFAPLTLILALAGCGGGAAPASSTPASSPAPATSVAASKPAAASAPVSAAASAKPAASISTAASAKPAASGGAAASGAAAASAKPAASGGAAASGAPSASGAAAAAPTIPAPVAVSVDPKTTAFLALDFNAAVCQPRPACMALVPKVADFLKKARDAKATVIYSSTPTANGTPAAIVSQIAPQSGEQVVASHADKFIGTDLDNILKKAGAKTLLVSGWAYNGAVLYTTFHANALGYTAAVLDDISGAETPYIDQLSRFQLLNEPGYTNADNKPLAANQVTLTTTSLVTFK